MRTAICLVGLLLDLAGLASIVMLLVTLDFFWFGPAISGVLLGVLLISWFDEGTQE